MLKKLIQFIRGVPGSSNVVEQSVNICPVCKSEYRAEFTKCSSCDVSLIQSETQDVTENNTKSIIAEKIHANDVLVDIKKGTIAQIKEYKRLLTQKGIPAMSFVEQGGAGKG